ncbi:biotin/lipoate--protein ligase family protein [Jannaschia marina]|uniref:biotin/lipoate--protein ligase family protein n=1 Tax=Jannaschia marina TaxID=2741674 RepID=UPI0015CB2099|nr:biotin/lipoate--protein ligase family protein [Jannaschia marina]
MPDFPPLLRGMLAAEPWAAAVEAARTGCDGGLICWRGGATLDAAIVFAPEVPLSEAAQMQSLTALALRDGLGAIGPAEMPVHLTWDGGVMVNGAEAGRVSAISPVSEPYLVPDWLVTAFTIRFLPVDDLERTALWSEGAGDVTPEDLLESWARHLMHRLSVWEEARARSLHADLTGCSWEVEAGNAGFVGLDEGLGRLRRVDGAVTLDPLTDLLEIP